LDAVLSALEVEAAEPDTEKRLLILRATRTIIDAWKRGGMTTSEAVGALRALSEANGNEDAHSGSVRRWRAITAGEDEPPR
jgi:hypothetical protein